VTKRHWWIGVTLALLAAVVALPVITQMVNARTDLVRQEECKASITSGEAKVRTDRWEDSRDLPDLGEYVEIHWQVRLNGSTDFVCSRMPMGPSDWTYQGVVRLRSADADNLAARYDWRPLSPSPELGSELLATPAEAWASLTPFVPAGMRWLHSIAYDEQAAGTRWRNVYFAPDHQLVFFFLWDH
jgi:hypothetical protein